MQRTMQRSNQMDKHQRWYIQKWKLIEHSNIRTWMNFWKIATWKNSRNDNTYRTTPSNKEQKVKSEVVTYGKPYVEMLKYYRG